MNSHGLIANNKICDFFKKILLGLFFCLSIFNVSACQSAQKSESYLGIGSNLTYSCTYDAQEDKTLVRWASYITNNTIYSISKVHVTFDYYFNDTLIETKELKYDMAIKNGKELNINCYFYADGQINKIVYKNWYCDYLNVWHTYKPWWIATIIVSSVLILAYIIIMIIEDLELADIGEFIVEHLYVFGSMLPILAIAIWGTISSNWVPILIVVCGFVAFAIAVLLAHLTKFIIEEASFSVDASKTDRSFNMVKNTVEEGFDPTCENVDDYINDEEKLIMFSASSLREYCRDNGIKGYSSATKRELVDLIINFDFNKIKDGSYEKKTITKSPITKKGKVTFDSIAGLENAKESFKDKVILPFEHPDLFEKFGKKAGGGILLYGLPGTGKTMFAEAASNELNALFIPIKCSDIKSKWYGESEQKIKQIFAKARKAERAIIFFDEFEAIGSKRTDDSNNGNNDLVPEILAEMQGVGSSSIKSTIMVIAATNKPWAIDSAFIRPGRFDEKIYIPLPDELARKKLFELQLSRLPLAEDLDFDYLAKITDGFNGADIKEFCEKLKISAIKDSLSKGEEQTIGMDDVQRVEPTIKSSVSKEDIEQLSLFEKGIK